MKNKNKNLITYGIAILFLAGLVAAIGLSGGKNGSNQSAFSAGVLTAVEEFFDFGTIAMKDGDVSHKFEIKNESSETVVIKKVYTSCMCTTAFIADAFGKKYGKFGMPGHRDVLSKTNIEIGAGESVVLEAVYDPAAHGPSGVGLAQRSIYIETNSSESPKMELSFQAIVTR